MRLIVLIAVSAWPLTATADPTTQPAAPTLAAAAPAQPPAASAALLAFYPAAARAAGVEGEARLHCERSRHIALRGCTLVSETPAGQGFGAAALALAAASPDNPKIDIPDAAQRPPVDFVVKFTLRPPAIAPDLTEVGHVVTQPELISRPTRAQIEAAYPPRALSDGIDGVAVIDCVVDAKGKLGGCRIAGERPTGYGFGGAALDLASDFQLKPRLLDGDPVASEVQVPVQFQSQDPTAPLELKTAPAGH